MGALWQSKKFKVALAAVLAAVAAGVTGVQAWGQVVMEVVAALLVFVGAQGVADAGKEKAKIEDGPIKVWKIPEGQETGDKL